MRSSRRGDRRRGRHACWRSCLPADWPTGCGPDAPEVDKSALYTPESLAEELAFRYRVAEARGAGSSARAAASAPRPPGGPPTSIAPARPRRRGAAPSEPKKRSGPPTLDDVMADIDSKIDKVQGTPRPEVCRKMIEALSKDASLSETTRSSSDRSPGSTGDVARLRGRASSVRMLAVHDVLAGSRPGIAIGRWRCPGRWRCSRPGSRSRPGTPSCSPSSYRRTGRGCR